MRKKWMNRNFSLDLIRTIAVFCVISVHFFLNSGYYNELLTSDMYGCTYFRNLFMVCVPLFLLLTGYLMNGKQATKSYFLGINKVLILYLISMLCIELFNMIIGSSVFSVKTYFSNLVNFRYYSWYVEMYIGLYFLIPFINMGLNELNKKQMRFLIVVLIMFTAMPSVFNTLDNWVPIYPITYYCIGAYLNKYDDYKKIHPVLNLIILFISILVTTILSIRNSNDGIFVWGTWCEYYSIWILLAAVSLFSFLLRIDFSNINAVTRYVIYRISESSFVMYLISCIFDMILYTRLNAQVFVYLEKLKYFFLIVPAVFLCSFISATLIEYVYSIGKKVCKNFCSLNVK